MSENRVKRKRRLSLGIALLFFISLFFWSVGDLLRTPSEVKWSRRQYALLLKHYWQEQGDWDAQRRQLVCSLSKSNAAVDQNIPLEVILSYLVETLGFAEGEFKEVALYPAKELSSLRFYLSKHESHPWPFRVLLSLEARLVYSEGRWEVEFLHFRRGKRELPTGLAWIYFGPELQRLRTFESFSDLAPGLALAQEAAH